MGVVLKVLIASIVWLSLLVAHAQEVVIVPVGQAELKSSGVAVGVISGASSKTTTQLEQIKEIMQNDFSFYRKIFAVVKNPWERPSTTPDYDYLKQKQLEYYVVLQSEGAAVVASFFDIAQNKSLGVSRHDLNEPLLRQAAHHLSDAFYQAVTGKASIFKSKMIFVSDRASSGKKQMKELYSMDFDGANIKRLTFHQGIVLSPAFSHSGKKVLYSLIREDNSRNRNINLFLLDLETMQNSIISSRPGINSGAVFLDSDNEVLVTLSHSGNAEIYKMNLLNSALTSVTKHFAIDVDPSINRDGSLMTFLSGRSGNPMIYTADPRGVEKDVKRISYVGKFNGTPRFSPDGKEIVFSSWLDERFDLFRIDANGANLSRLTKNFGSNEDPTYSNDGEFIAFTSKRVLSRTSATQQIYIIDREGEVLGNITKNFGNCTSPRWSR